MGSWLNQFVTGMAHNPLPAVMAALVAGLVSAFSPCVLATVPLIVGYVGGFAGHDQRLAFRYSLVFCAGLVVTFTTLGGLAAYFGQLLSGLGKGWHLLLGGILLFAALQLLGIIQIDSLCRLPRLRRKGVLGAFILGLLAGVISSPCATPVLVAILAMVATRASILFGVLLLAVYGVGHCAPLLVAGTSVGMVRQLSASPRTEYIGRIMKTGLGILALMGAFYLIYQGL